MVDLDKRAQIANSLRELANRIEVTPPHQVQMVAERPNFDVEVWTVVVASAEIINVNTNSTVSQGGYE